jgi:pantoate--beta-alanine ligase
MQIIKSISGMQRLARLWQHGGQHVAFVPTMGSLHAGHLSLVARARRLAGKRGKVIVSIYVNPTQFGPKEDFARYPRDLSRDAKLCRAAGVDVVFAPNDREMYPGKGKEEQDGAARAFSTYVQEEALSRVMEGASRPGHFRGVTTVVAKLFNIIQPQFAVFGAKDYQQAAIVKRMVQDLNFPLRIVVAPTVREPDGLALSSRNKYLTADLRRQALVLRRYSGRVRDEVRRASKPLSGPLLKTRAKSFIESEPDASLDYVEFFEPESLRPVSEVSRGTHVALAVFIGKTRLIDNVRL